MKLEAKPMTATGAKIKQPSSKNWMNVLFTKMMMSSIRLLTGSNSPDCSGT